MTESSFSSVVSVPPLAATPAMALLRWHETGRCVPPVTSDVLEWSGDDVVAWLRLPHRATVRCGDGWCEARIGADGVLHLPDHNGRVPEQHSQLLDVLARGAAARVRAWLGRGRQPGPALPESCPRCGLEFDAPPLPRRLVTLEEAELAADARPSDEPVLGRRPVLGVPRQAGAPVGPHQPSVRGAQPHLKGQ